MESEPESEPEATGTDFEINTLDDDAWTEQKTETSEAEGSEEQPQRSKEEQDLLDMIADLPSDEELSGLAESLRTDGQNDEADLNKMETRGTEEAETALTEEDTAKADKKEKKGFFKKLVSVLFGESEEDELPEKEETSEAAEAAVPPEDLENMSEENRQILEELNAAGKAKEEDKPEDKEDKKKEKKAKKEKGSGSFTAIAKKTGDPDFCYEYFRYPFGIAFIKPFRLFSKSFRRKRCICLTGLCRSIQ